LNGELLLTGSTGFVGMELLARTLERTDRPVIALVRARDPRHAEARIDGVLGELFGTGAETHRGRVEAICADLPAPGLGLAPAVRDELAERTSTIVHSAASVSFTLGLDEARAVNVEGTRHVLELAEHAQRRGGLHCYGHISTAYVAGTHSGRYAESDLDVGQRFHNTYEQTKFEAERLVRERDLPARILRPSIVVGDRHNGWTAAFNVLYWPLKALSLGLFDAIPADPASPVDVVSVDYVADAIHALCHDPATIGRDGVETYHLTAGTHAATLGEICASACRYFGRPVPRVLPPAQFAALEAEQVGPDSALRAGQIYFPYFSLESEFSDVPTRARLEPAGIRVSPLSDYLERLLDFATRSRWGKQRIARAEAFAV
jgi:thioester reductase-like protein